MFKEVSIDINGVLLEGHLASGPIRRSWVIFAHGSGSSRMSTRNNWVAQKLNEHGYGTFLFDLLTKEEDSIYANRFNIPLLAERLLGVTKWLSQSDYYSNEPIAYFGASTGAAAALLAAAKTKAFSKLFTVISRGGRPDLAGKELNLVSVPVLMIVGSRDVEVIRLNEIAKRELQSSELVLVPGATHLFEEPGALNEVVNLTINWLDSHLPTHMEETL
jgi:putative phosphoribosyl transferase